MIDHLVYGTPELAGTVARLSALGVALSPGGRHVGLGTRNHLADLGGGAYLEVIGPDLEQPVPEGPRPFGIDTLTSERLLTWAVRVDGIDAAIAAARAAGHDPGPAHEMHRDRPDGVRLAWRLTAPPAPELDGLVPFLIDWADTPHPAASAAPGARLVDLRATHPDPAAVASWLDALGVRADLTVAAGPRTFTAVLETPTGPVELH
ncbi:VOC family protein [Pseudonocardia sp. CA-107938]|uniref:VOC family protein n=1 Tax=Pseudonocardia sp. CA-107938 TaxID=3240021 RepID=UPI003D8F3E26